MSRAPHGTRAARLVRLGLRQAGAPAALVRGRVHREGAGDVVVPYAAGSGATCAALAVAAAVEAAAVHLAVPWERLGGWAWTQWAALGASVCGLVWVYLWWAALRVHPHLLRDDELVLRAGAAVVARVPLAAVAAATPRRRGAPARGDRLVLGVLGGDTNLDLELVAPVAGRDVRGRERRVAAVSLGVDDPAAAARAITAALEGRGAPGPVGQRPAR